MVSNVVVGFDFTPGSRIALQRAVSFAARRPQNVLHFLCVVEPPRSLPGLPHHGHADLAYCERVQTALTEVVVDELRRAAALERVHFCIHVRIGGAADEILMLAGEVGADLIIIGKRELDGVGRILLGSVAERVVREAGCSVEIARPKTYAYVERYEMREVEPSSHHYVPPHRYTYDQACQLMRPDEWPLY
jgi:nucleotide-binding universal stress UspA family protein